VSDGRAAVLVAALAAATCSLRAVGPVAVGRRQLPRWLRQRVELVAPALLAALVVWQVFTQGGRVVIDARVVGLAAAAAAIVTRVPLPFVLVAAAAATAIARSLL
jgi:branched-subunit amino acid transport protein